MRYWNWQGFLGVILYISILALFSSFTEGLESSPRVVQIVGWGFIGFIFWKLGENLKNS